MRTTGFFPWRFHRKNHLLQDSDRRSPSSGNMPSRKIESRRVDRRYGARQPARSGTGRRRQGRHRPERDRARATEGKGVGARQAPGVRGQLRHDCFLCYRLLSGSPIS
ncbi:hypothetical protein AvCA_14180 [Azotobacter vinelandii CA]|uniref:Uncharacterized protein n=2 Tax=Azotobacter vinelandii TaxID=354 RepID=C1DQW1_AZOVD|nr:hypothetical protein Avin_14180 [Azotobacter vinelandii DJ]AGK17005.1 hypothetical protein AvCA_14180 [Azotobacter vinelandii CA]AGK19897.1 hypothetical protein AvCA6_14180 [Azotobacter vinelandii CA6]